MKNDFNEEELKQIDRELAELRKHIQEKKKRYIIGPDGEPLLDPAGMPILKKQTINFKTSDGSKKGWLHITENFGSFFQDQEGNLTKLEYIFKDANDNMYFEDRKGNCYLEEKDNNDKTIVNIKDYIKEPPKKYATYFTFDENGNVRPNKAKSINKIDPAMALIIAHTRAYTHELNYVDVNAIAAAQLAEYEEMLRGQI